MLKAKILTCSVFFLFAFTANAEQPAEEPYKKRIDGIEYMCRSIIDKNGTPVEGCRYGNYGMISNTINRYSTKGEPHFLCNLADAPEKNMAWVLMNFPNDSEKKSAVSLFEYDCKKNKVRIIHSTSYKDYFGRGKVINSQRSAQEWGYYNPGSAASVIRNYVCTSN